MQFLKSPKNPYVIPAMIIAAVLLVGIVLAGIFSSAAPPPVAQAPAPIAAAPVAAAPVAAVPVVAAAAPAPVIVNAPAPSSGTSDMLLGAAAGYMLGSAGNRNAAPVHAPAPARPIVQKTVIHKTVVVQQRPRPIVRPQPAAKDYSYRASRPSTPSRSSSFSARSSRK